MEGMMAMNQALRQLPPEAPGVIDLALLDEMRGREAMTMASMMTLMAEHGIQIRDAPPIVLPDPGT